MYCVVVLIQNFCSFIIKCIGYVLKNIPHGIILFTIHAANISNTSQQPIKKLILNLYLHPCNFRLPC